MRPFTRTIKEVFTPLWVERDFSTFNETWVRVRQNLPYKANTCFKCGAEFKHGDAIGLIALKGVGNKVFCGFCCDELSENGNIES
jgi:hypothetical protein